MTQPDSPVAREQPLARWDNEGGARRDTSASAPESAPAPVPAPASDAADDAAAYYATDPFTNALPIGITTRLVREYRVGPYCYADLAHAIAERDRQVRAQSEQTAQSPPKPAYKGVTVKPDRHIIGIKS